MARRINDILTIISLITLALAIILGIATHLFPRSSTRILSPSNQRTTQFARGSFRIIETQTTQTPTLFSSSSEEIVKINFWTLIPFTLIFPALWLLDARAGGRKPWLGRHWLCQKCGYDLRSTPARCPECGTRAQNPWLQNRHRRR